MIAAVSPTDYNGRLTKLSVGLFILFLATALDSVTIEGKNVLLISYAFFGMVVLTVIHFKAFPSLRHDWLTMMILYFVVVSAFNFQETQPLSLAYAVFFIGAFIFYLSFARNSLSLADYRSILKLLILLHLDHGSKWVWDRSFFYRNRKFCRVQPQSDAGICDHFHYRDCACSHA